MFILLQQEADSHFSNIMTDSSIAEMVVSTTYSINFDTDPAGNALIAGTTNFTATQPYQNLFGTGSGVTFSTDNPTTKPLNLYDTEGNTNEDPDLERNSEGTGLWEGGNLTNDILYNSLIINTDTNISVPNDNGTGGDIVLDFDLMLSSFGFTFVDLDDNKVVGSNLIFTNTITNEMEMISFADMEGSSSSIHSTPGVDFGDRHGNRINPITATNLGISEFNRVTFSQDGSGGIGSVKFETSEPVCAPIICRPISFIISLSNN